MRRLLRCLRRLVPVGLRLHVEFVRHDVESLEVGHGIIAEVPRLVARLILREREQAAAALRAALGERDAALADLAALDDADADRGAEPAAQRARVDGLERQLAEAQAQCERLRAERDVFAALLEEKRQAEALMQMPSVGCA